MVILEVLSPLPLTNREDGKAILDLWNVHLPNLLPDLYGNWEPLDCVFNLQRIDAVLDHWKWPFLAVKSNPSVDASVWMRKGANQQLHATLIFRIDPAAATQDQLLAFLKAAAIRLHADFACIHLLNPAEYTRGETNKTVTSLDKHGRKMRFFIASKDLQQRLPELYWATVFGACYSKMFGRDCLLRTPGFTVEALSTDTVLLQLTEKLVDVAERADLFNDVRLRAKTHLGKDAFFQPDISDDHVYRAPHFRFV